MKKIALFMGVLAMFSFISCGSSREEQEKQKRVDDSLMEKERNAALEKANNLLADTVTSTSDTAKSGTKSK